MLQIDKIKFITIIIFILFSSIVQTGPAFAIFSQDKKELNINYNFYSTDKPLPNENIDISDSNIKKIDIFQAIHIALEKNPETKISMLSIKQKAAGYRESKSAYMPLVELGGSYSHKKSKLDTTETEAKTIKPEVLFDWLLYDFGKRHSLVQKEYFTLLSSEHQHNSMLQNIIYKAILNYCNLFSAKESVQAAFRANESSETAYNTAKEKYNLGLVPWGDVIKAETSYSQSVLEQQKAENSEALYRGLFLKSLNIPHTTEIELISSSFIDNYEMPNKSVSILIKKAIQSRPDLMAIIFKEKSIAQSKKAAIRDRFPSISLYGSSGYTNTDTNIHESIDQTESLIGIRVNIPLFSGFKKTYSIEKAEYTLKSVFYEKEKLKNEIAFEVWEAFYSLKTAEETCKTSENLLKSATESKEVALGMYKVGRGSILEVLQTEAQYAYAEKERISARYQRFIAQASLLKSLGILNHYLLKNKGK